MPGLAGTTIIAEYIVPHWIYLTLYAITCVFIPFYMWGFARVVHRVGGPRIFLRMLYDRFFKRKDDDDDDEDDRRGGKMIPVRGAA